MTKKVKEPKNPFHPGQMLLEEFLQPMGMTQTAFAEKTGGLAQGSMSSSEASVE